MKKLIGNSFVLLLSILLIVACNDGKKKNKDKNEFVVHGQIDNLDADMTYLYLDKGGDYDSIAVDENGKFELSDTISELSMLRASPMFRDNPEYSKEVKEGGFIPTKSSSLMLFVYPGADVEISGEVTDFMDAYPSDDKYNKSLAEINKLAYPYYNKATNLHVESTYKEDSAKVKQLESKSDSVSEIGFEKRLNYVKNNLNSAGALWYLNDMIRRGEVDDDQAVDIFEKVPDSQEDNPYYKKIETRVSGILATKEGSEVPEINTKATLDGERFNIEAYEGKYVLIDFWGTWCGPCVAEMPKVKEYQKKYADELRVLGINSGDNKEQARDFLEEKSYEWQQIMSSKENSSDNFVNRFNVQGFPTKFLIDPEGKIVKRSMGSGEEIFALLDELLKDDA